MTCDDNEQWNKPSVEKIIPKYTEENFGRKFRMNILGKTNIALQKKPSD